jgi:hypothetical protein
MHLAPGPSSENLQGRNAREVWYEELRAFIDHVEVRSDSGNKIGIDNDDKRTGRRRRDGFGSAHDSPACKGTPEANLLI